jgi:RNA polymerase sigma-70 factor (ECF subfamily)
VKREGEGDADGRSDAELLAAVDADPEAFAVFYERHVRAVFVHLAHLTASEGVALELTTEAFATALQRSGRLRRRRGAASREWLTDIAEDALAYSYRSGGVKDTARRKLGMSIEPCSDEDWEAVADRIRGATDGPLHVVARNGASTSIRGALSRRIFRGAG